MNENVSERICEDKNCITFFSFWKYFRNIFFLFRTLYTSLEKHQHIYTNTNNSVTNLVYVNVLYTKVLKRKNIFSKYFQNEKKVIQFLHSYILSLSLSETFSFISTIPMHSLTHGTNPQDSVTKHYECLWLIP
jgi:hypothetical protein